MSRELRQVSLSDLQKIVEASALLGRAQALLRQSGANKSCAYVARSIKSVDGAYNHAKRCYHQQTGIVVTDMEVDK